ncbi:MAG: type II secretion system F family protein [Candidatus Eremiobacteraeota bacterium]|nr:type II secretion system F family protein [Candidatus Eremiobacteraeota bacterium]
MIGVLIFAVLLGGIALFAGLRPGAASVHDRLAELEASHGVAPRQGTLMRFFSEQQQKLLVARFIEAGWHEATPSKFVAGSIGGAATGSCIGLAFAFFVHASLMLDLICGFVLCFGGFYLPTAQLDRAIKERKLSITRALPDFLDIVSATMEAGIALNGAIGVAVQGLDGALSEELQFVLQDIRLGRSRSEALLAAASRVREPAFSATVTAIVQADKLGGDIVEVLDQLAMDARDHRLARAEELANALPNKLVFPMALFMLPSLFILIFGALVAHLVSQR